MSTIYGEGFVADRFAQVGDSVQCDVRYPTPRTITMILSTPEAAAHANELLADKSSGWRLAPAASALRPRLDCGGTGALKDSPAGMRWPLCDTCASTGTAGVPGQEGGQQG